MTHPGEVSWAALTLVFGLIVLELLAIRKNNRR